MKKGFKIYAVCWAVLLVLFNAVCFVTPSEAAGLSKFGGAFWAGYIFITAAFIGQLVCAYLAFKAENLKKLFYNLPIIKISYAGLILTMIFGGIAMAIPDLPGWVGAVLCLIILGFNAIAVIKAKAAAEVVGKTDEKIAADTAFIKELTAKAQNLVNRAKNETAKQECKKVYDAVRYSDPVSNAELREIESKIKFKFGEFSDALHLEDEEKIKNIAEETITLLKERNSKSKLNK